MKRNKLRLALNSLIPVILIYLIMSFVVVMILYEQMFARVEVSEYHPFISYEDMSVYPSREFTFDSDGYTLKGKIYDADNSEGAVILVHGKDGTAEDMLTEARYFLDCGYSAVVFDLTGHGRSNGNTQVGLYKAVKDVRSAVNYVSEDEKLSKLPIYLYGFGVGGYASAACSDMENVKAVAAVSAFSDIPAVTLDYAVSKMNIFGYLEYPVMLFYQYLVFGGDMGPDAADIAVNSGKPILVINGTDDSMVKYKGSALGASDIIRNSKNCSIMTVDGGKHSSLMRSERAIDLAESFNNEVLSLYQNYGNEVPAFAIETLYEQFDRNAMSELEADRIGAVADFFRGALM